MEYLNGRFTIDFLSALPLDLIAGIFVPEGNTKQMRLVSVLKLVRMLRLSKMLRAMNVEK